VRSRRLTRGVPLIALVVSLATTLQAGDWPQWRGPERDGRIPDLQARDDWPRSLAPAWKVRVGEGHSSPVVVGDRVFVFSRQ
jgi:outer membrane protein assembly factor BamB